MIDFNKLKMVLWDFDDTLCVHKNHKNLAENDLTYNVNVLLKGKDAWKDCDANYHMRQFAINCKNSGVRQGLLSACNSSKHAQGKVDWVNDRYEIELENFCVGTPEQKLEMLLAIAEAYGFKRNEILLVDDYWRNFEDAANAGFQACTPIEIVNYIENMML